MEIWIKEENNDESTVKLPVLPSSFEVALEYNNQTVDVNRIGTINLIGKPGLKTLPITSFFPRYYNATFCNGSEADLKDPYEYVSAIENLEGKICRIVITDANIDMLCLISSFTYAENDGTGDVTYTIELTEYKALETARVKVRTIKRKTYKTKAKDTLGKIAKKKLGSASKWNVLYNNNIKACNKAFKNKKYAAQNKKKGKKNKLFVKGVKMVIPK